MYSNRHLPDIEQWSQNSGSNVITRRARPGLAGLRPHNVRQARYTGRKNNKEAERTLSLADGLRSGARDIHRHRVRVRLHYKEIQARTCSGPCLSLDPEGDGGVDGPEFGLPGSDPCGV